jgi:hypothetical protein
MCEAYSDIMMSAALCGHSLLMALLHDTSLEFPSKHSTKKLELRGKQSRLPSAWALEDEDNEEDAQDTNLHWCPVTPCDDMELVPAPKRPKAQVLMQSDALACCILAFICIPWSCWRETGLLFCNPCTYFYILISGYILCILICRIRRSI